MAVAFDAVGPSSAGASSTGSVTLSWTHTSVGSSCALFVGIGVGINPDTGVSVTVALDPSGANTPFVSLGPLVHSNAGTSGFVALFGLPNTSSGAHTITATVTGGTPSSMEGGSLSYTGAHATTPFGTQVGATGTTNTSPVIVTGTTAGNMVAGSAVCAASVTGVSVGTSRWITNVNTTTNAGNQGGGDAAVSGGSTTITWTHATDWWAAAAVEVVVVPPVPMEGPQNSSAMNLMGKAYY